MRDPADLHVHRLIRTMPQWSDEDEQFRALGDDIEENGIREPIKITAKNAIVDGRHRWRAAKRYQLTQVPVMVVPEEEAAEIAVGTLLHRRHYTPGQRAYLLAGILDEAFEEARRRRARNAAKNETNSVRFVSRTPEDYAAELGVSLRYLQLARELHELFRDETRRTLTDAEGVQERDVTFREFYEPRLMREERPYGLGAVKAGIAFILDAEVHPHKKTGGKPQAREKQLKLFNQVLDDELKRWDYWQRFDAEERMAHFKAVRTRASKLPSDQLQELAEYHSKLASEFRRLAKQPS